MLLLHERNAALKAAFGWIRIEALAVGRMRLRLGMAANVTMTTPGAESGQSHHCCAMNGFRSSTELGRGMNVDVYQSEL